MSQYGQSELPPPIVAADNAYTQDHPMTQPGQFQSSEYQTQPGENVINYEPNGYAQQYSQTYYQPQGDDEARYAAEQEAQQQNYQQPYDATWTVPVV